MTLQPFHSSKKTNHQGKILIISSFLTFLAHIFLKFIFIKYHYTLYLFKYMRVLKSTKINLLQVSATDYLGLTSTGYKLSATLTRKNILGYHIQEINKLYNI
jgi:hypothetical protein